MSISFQELRKVMKSSGIPVFRDAASTDAKYPYIVYEFVNETQKRASSHVHYSMPLYQITLITKGTESDYEPLKKAFNENKVEYAQFDGLPYDENDDTITQFITYVRCVN
ncbi:hypothetical protein [Terribacillus saccharophilus]|uniref:hypothetical protein n=1 Tax=Terribacillus saccharophilus TaxID=361277 RepID=UPI002DCA554D|nr:hypothetical protein [Terribacillus saccharophilus]MEC0288917.1 hypothetical protein [Terribacillus saccharophilus]